MNTTVGRLRVEREIRDSIPRHWSDLGLSPVRKRTTLALGIRWIVSIFLACCGCETGDHCPWLAVPLLSRHAAVDLDGDGQLDLVACDADGCSAFRRTPDGFEGGEELLAVPGYAGFAVGDVDGDGQEDVVAHVWSSDAREFHVAVVLNHSSQLLESGRFAREPGCHQITGLSDVDGDGRLDIVCDSFLSEDATYVVTVLHGDGTGKFEQPRVAGVVSECTWGSTGAILTDLDQDGVDDVLVPCREVVFMRGNGAGDFEQRGVIATGGWAVAVASGDFDGDGHLDVATTHLWQNDSLCAGGGPGTLEVYPGIADGTFGEPVEHLVAEDPISLAVADFDGDGQDDIVIVHLVEQESGILILLSDDRTFRRVELEGGGLWVTADDMDGDGDVDIVVSTGASQISFYANDGVGNFGAPQMIPLSVGNDRPATIPTGIIPTGIIPTGSRSAIIPTGATSARIPRRIPTESRSAKADTCSWCAKDSFWGYGSTF